MIIDGKALAEEQLQALQNEVSHLRTPPHLTVIVCQPSFATKKYLAFKLKAAKRVGIGCNCIELPQDTTTEEAIMVVKQAALQTDGVIVQLPLPDHIDRSAVLRAIPSAVDIDGVHYARHQTGLLPPVVGAIQLIASREGVVFEGQKVVVVGDGLLVGKPVAAWAKARQAEVEVVTKETEHREEILRGADILVTGAGVPGLVTTDMVKPGVVVFDAGTAEDNGELKGDVDEAVAEVASLYTPVPGGIGPLTVAMLLQNVLASVR